MNNTNKHLEELASFVKALKDDDTVKAAQIHRPVGAAFTFLLYKELKKENLAYQEEYSNTLAYVFDKKVDPLTIDPNAQIFISENINQSNFEKYQEIAEKNNLKIISLINSKEFSISTFNSLQDFSKSLSQSNELSTTVPNLPNFSKDPSPSKAELFAKMQKENLETQVETELNPKLKSLINRISNIEELSKDKVDYNIKNPSNKPK